MEPTIKNAADVERGELVDIEKARDEATQKAPAKVEKKISILKVNAKKRIVYGVVYAPDEADAHDMFMKTDTIENAAHRFLAMSREMDERHDFIKGAGVPVESFIVRDGDKDFIYNNGPNKGKAKVGAWVIGSKVVEERVWKKIMKGDIKAFSLAGVASFGKEVDMDSKWYDEDGNFVNPYDN